MNARAEENDDDSFEVFDNEEPMTLDDWDPIDDEDEDDEDPSVAEERSIVTAKMRELREIYVNTDREAVLASQFERLLEEKDGLGIRRWAGLLVKAPSGAGKTRMVSQFLQEHPRVHRFGEEETNFIHIDVPSPVTNKSLGLEVLRTMYPQKRSAMPTPKHALQTLKEDDVLSDIWTEARSMAEELGVWGLWIDESHDLRNGGPKMLAILQSTIKRWMSHAHRPIIILSGTLETEDIFLTREFRRRFLHVESPTLSADTDTDEIRRTIAIYLRSAGLGIDSSLSGDFMPRLVHAGTRQIGWTIDVVLESIRAALLAGADNLARVHFADSYRDIVQCQDRDNPFVAEDWAGIDTLLHRGRTDQPTVRRRGRPKRGDGPW